MISYEKLRKKSKRFLALTGLYGEEFDAILPNFQKAYETKYVGKKTLEGTKRKRKAGGGDKGTLVHYEDKLVFILIYQKTYPLEELMGELFGMEQPKVNQWIHRLLPILEQALTEMGMMPERKAKQFSKTERKKSGPRAHLVIDGTDRARQRPKDKKKQAEHYSGKTKSHSDKNIVIVEKNSTRVGYLSPTYPGKVHDKKIVDEDTIVYPRHATLSKDSGFQGYEPRVKKTRQPKKNLAGEN